MHELSHPVSHQQSLPQSLKLSAITDSFDNIVELNGSLLAVPSETPISIQQSIINITDSINISQLQTIRGLTDLNVIVDEIVGSSEELKTIYNNNPEEAIKSWSKGLMTPNCDEKDHYCKEHCCCHIMNDFYVDNIDVKQMVKLMLLLKKS